MSTTKTRYSNSELEEFKNIILSKTTKTKEQVDNLEAQILEISENNGDDHGGDWSDDSTTNTQVEYLNTMLIRQRSHLHDLENTMIRIDNGTYGICSVTGDLISKERLRAVPTTTKSISAKNKGA